MPYLDNGDVFINPYYLDVNPLVRYEMYQRAQYYAAYTRTAIRNESMDKFGRSDTVEFPYQKMPWAYVTSKVFISGSDPFSVTLGFDETEKDGIKANSDKDGNLTLYESVRNVPKYPLLTGIEISNEGLRGSLLKGKFSFTIFPDITLEGFDLLNIQRAFFTPGVRVNIGFGWSVHADNIETNQLKFEGVIYGFNWSFNQNSSISAEVQIVSPAALAIGLSGDQTLFQDPSGDSTKTDEVNQILDASGSPLKSATNIISVIERDIRSYKGPLALQVGTVERLHRDDTECKLFDYFQIGLPISSIKFEDASVDRLRMTDEERRAEEQREEELEDLDDSTINANPIEDLGKVGPDILPPGDWDEKRLLANDLLIKRTSPNSLKEGASWQMYVFYEDFNNNNGDLSGDWVIRWQDKFSNTSFGRYVWPDNSNLQLSFDLGYWESSAQKSWTDFFTELEKTPEADRKLYIEKQIASLAIQELEELKLAMFYSRNPQNMELVGGIGKGGKIQFFWADQSDKTVKKDPYFWPDNLKISLSTAITGKPKHLTMKTWYEDTFNKFTQVINLRKSYEGKDAIGLLKEFHNPKHLSNGVDSAEKRLNTYITQLKNFVDSGNIVVRKEGMDSEINTAESPKATSKEHKDLMDKYINELKLFQSKVSNSKLYLDQLKGNGNSDTIKNFLKEYPNEKMVGGVDVKTLKDNMLEGFKLTVKSGGPKVTQEMVAQKKAEHAYNFIQKVIDERKKEKENGKDTVKDLLKNQSNKYRDKLNGNNKKQKKDNKNKKEKNTADSNDLTEQEFKPQLVGLTYWYITFANLVEFANKILEQFEESTDFAQYNYQKFRIKCDNNETEYQPNIKSADPINVYFPDVSMGAYHAFNPFYNNIYSDFLRQFYIPLEYREKKVGSNIKFIKYRDKPKEKVRIEDDVINIGNILLGINMVMKAYKEFILDTSTQTAYRNITGFFDYIIRQINASSGETYQLTTHAFTEPEKLYPKILTPSDSHKMSSERSSIGSKALLSIEDTNIARKHTPTYPPEDMADSKFSKEFGLYAPDPESDAVFDLYTVVPFTFDATIFKPVIKNVNISSRPPKELAYAAYVAARGYEAKSSGNNPLAKPYSGDATVLNPQYKDEETFKKLREKNNKEKLAEEKLVSTEGFSDRWAEHYRTLLVRYKRLSSGGAYLSGRGFPVGDHWLNKAIYPVDFTVTIDGINGFKFGDVLKTTMLPTHYNVDWDMVFTVTKIIHKITPSTWETTLNTAARLSLDSKRRDTLLSGTESTSGNGSTSGTGSTSGNQGTSRI